jgi:adenylylsulfate kinase
MIVMMAGLSGTGKSTLAAQLAAALPGVVLNKDAVRAALFPPPYTEYSTTQDDFVVSLLLQTAAYLLDKAPATCVLLDGRPFSKQYQVEAVVAFAATQRTPLRIIECVTSDETARARIERDLATGTHPAANRTFAMYLEVKARFQPIVQPKLVIDTEQPLEQCLALALRYCRE